MYGWIFGVRAFQINRVSGPRLWVRAQTAKHDLFVEICYSSEAVLLGVLQSASRKYRKSRRKLCYMLRRADDVRIFARVPVVVSNSKIR